MIMHVDIIDYLAHPVELFLSAGILLLRLHHHHKKQGIDKGMTVSPDKFRGSI